MAIDMWEALDSLSSNVGIDFLDEEIDAVILQTNSFLTDETFLGSNGPFWWILQMCMALGAMFSLIMAAGMAYKMMAKNEPLDVLKILRVLGIAIVMCWWYPPSITGIGFSTDWSILEGLAYIPNAVGSFTNDLYEAEAAQVNDKYKELIPLLCKRDTMMVREKGLSAATNANINNAATQEETSDAFGTQPTVESGQDASILDTRNTYVGFMILVDKIVTWLAMVLFRVGWWGTMFCQQLLLGMLTIFGPIQWAFSILPKWEGAWAKWLTRYLTVHFYGAMLYFVGFYVLLLFDIVISLQIENLSAITDGQEAFRGYIQNAFMTSGYLLVASIVALQCLNLVPDLAAWMIPEGDTAFSTRNFGQGVASQAKASASSVLHGRI